jgi:exodeoxyribonuclease VII small subunit
LTPALAAATKQRMAEDLTALSFEDALKRLEAIVQRLESGDASLDESITLYTEGDRLRAQCEARLKDAQARIDKISLGADGVPTGTVPFDAA